MNVTDKILRTSRPEQILANISLFRKYELSFHNMELDNMISVKKIWKIRNPAKNFYKEYSRYVKDDHASKNIEKLNLS